MHPFNNAFGVFVLASALGGCAEYLDRRDTISELGGNAVATNMVTHMVDPWPAESANRNIAFNGPKMQSAVERYRTNQVYSPKGTGTSGTYGQSQQQNNTAPLGPTVTQSAAPVK